jgi:3'-phosphoadenosine 5'-phosphosulfate sulfotransferase (PAPS reductase)/FAD synthetase
MARARGKYETIAVWFSCGAASAMAAMLTLQKYRHDIRYDVRILNNPIKEEHTDNQRFLNDVSAWLQHPIEQVVSGTFPSQSCEDVWQRRKYMAGIGGAPCTDVLKRKARQSWENENKPNITVLGFTAEEEKRAEKFKLTERSEVYFPLIENGYTKQRCFDELKIHGLKLPQIYELGFPNANCIGCCKATSASYWNLVREKFPDVFTQREATSRQLGAKLVRANGERIFLDELDPKQKGQPLKEYNFECGLFCEEWVHGES